MPRMLTFLALLLWAGTSAAQILPGMPGTSSSGSEPAADGAPAADAAAAPPSTEALIELLRDDAAREALIRQLEAGAAASESAPEGQAPAEGAEAAGPVVQEPATLGREISQAVGAAADRLYEQAFSIWSQLERVPARLTQATKAAEPELIRQALTELAFVVATTYAAFFLFRILSRRVSRSLSNAATGSRWYKRTFLSLTSSGLDAVIVWLSVIVSLTAASVVYGSEEQAMGTLQLNYLTAFTAVEMGKVAGRAVLAPRFEQLRLIPLGTGAAQRIWGWLSISIGIVGYSQLLVVPFVQREAGYLAAFAITSLFGAAVVLYTLFTVLRHRRAVAAWLHQEDTTTTRQKIAATLADYWHIPLVLYLLGLLVIVLIRPGNVLMPLLKTSLQAAALIVVWLFLRKGLKTMVRRGVRFSPQVREMLPMLETRVNRILPRLALVIRGVMALIVLVGLFEIVGLTDVWNWAFHPDGGGIGPGVLSVMAIVIVATGIWLAIASWVDYRLNPSGYRQASSRERTLLTLLYNASTIALVIITGMIVLSELGINIAPLLASAGVLGLAIGFGAQKLVQDIITGIFIQFENAINVGDVITVGGVTGAVEKLTVRSVSLRDVEGVFHIIPFSSVDLVSNFMRDFSYFVADIGVAYREDMEMAKQAMFDAFEELRKDPDQGQFILGDLEWFGLNSFGDSAIVLRARIKTLPGKQWGVGRAYNLIIKRIFDERSIEIPFPHQTIYFGEDRSGRAPALHIKAEPGSNGGEAPQIKHDPSSTE